MAEQNHPLLLFPAPSTVDRNARPGRGFTFAKPSGARQGARLTPKFNSLTAAFEAERLRLQQTAPAENPEFVIVFETVGTVANFAKAVSRVPGLEWLSESIVENINPDEDFYIDGEEGKALTGRLFLLGTNQQALAEILALWQRYQQEPNARFQRGLAPWKHVFEQLRDVRRWSLQDRLDPQIRAYWEDAVASGVEMVRFEIDAWCYRSQQLNQESKERIQYLVQLTGGEVISSILIPEISYHGFLVDIPAQEIVGVLAGNQPELVLSDRIMLFRPRAQSMVSPHPTDLAMPSPNVAVSEVTGDPIVALLDGLPLQNHALLAGRLVIDDPDGWEAAYEAKDRAHGTAMASLIIHGELDAPSQPLDRPIYVRPVLRPDFDDVRPRRIERTPNDILLVDLIHGAVKRICEGAAGDQPAAPSVRVINLSIGDESRVFERDLSPWARLLDWLSFKYQVLFVVSSGNCDGGLRLDAPRDTIAGLNPNVRNELALQALLSSDVNRRLIAPAEAINVLTVGASHADTSVVPLIHGRFNLFEDRGVSPYSRIGHGFRRAIKPEILMPGGRVLHRERPVGLPEVTDVELVTTAVSPGHKVASPPGQGLQNATEYCRGSSNAAALATRAAAHAFNLIDVLRATRQEALPPRFDAVLMKALIAHGATWGDVGRRLLGLRPDLTDWRTQREFVSRWLGYGLSDVDRALTCTAQRATLLGVGEIKQDEAQVFSVPLPPSLSAKAVLRRMTVTLAWISPVSSSVQAYRIAKLWISPPQEELRVTRTESVHDHAQRGTLQHDILEGEDAVAFVDGDKIQIKVNCAADARDFDGAVPFAICFSLEVPVATDIPIYQEVRERVAAAIQVNPV